MAGNDAAGITFQQPTTFDQRSEIAEQCSERLDFKSPVLIDTINDQTSKAYSAFPDRLYIIDLDGRVAYKGGRGPFGYKPRELEQTLVLLMMDAQIKARQKQAARETSPKPEVESQKPPNQPTAQKPSPQKSKADGPAKTDPVKKNPAKKDPATREPATSPESSGGEEETVKSKPNPAPTKKSKVADPPQNKDQKPQDQQKKKTPPSPSPRKLKKPRQDRPEKIAEVASNAG